MTKRALSLLFLSVLFFFASTAWSATVNLTSTIKFEPKEDVTETYFTIDETAPSSPFITSITTKYAFSASNVSGQKGKYHITNGVAEFGYNNDTEGLTLLTFTFDNLVIGQTYTFTLTGKFSANDIQLSRGFSGFNNVSGAGPEWPQFNHDLTTNKWTFTANSKQGSATFGYNPSHSNKGQQVFTFTQATLTGPCEEMVSSSLGYEVCAGDITTLSAIGQGVTAPIVWESSVDGSTWTTMPNETAIDIQVVVTDKMFYRAKKGTKILYTPLVPGSSTQHQAIKPVICCAKAGDLTPIFTESFDLIDDDIIQLMGSNRGKFKSNDITTYSYASGTFPAGSYAILKMPSQGGHWTSSHIKGGNTQRPVSQGGMGQNPAKDGFYLADCGKEAGTIFTYTVEDNALCSNTVYDFSAFICNVDKTSGHAPVNATLSVVGKKAGQPDYEFFNIPTGDLAPGSDWGQYGRSFNSGDYTKFVVTIRNNYQGEETTVIGNDIGVDDIVFSACRPEIQIYSNNQYEPIVVVCNNGAVQELTLEALAVYDLTEFFDTPYYFFQTSASETGPWSPVATAASTNHSITINVDPTQYQNGLYYRVWVGATQAAVEASAASGQPGTGCQALTAVSDPIKITYECECTASPAPTTENWNKCPQTDKLDLNTLITNRSTTGTYTWYTSNAENAPALSATEVQNIDVSQYDATNPTRTYYVSYDQDGSAVETYCPSPKVKVEVTVKQAYDIVNNIIPGDLCRSFLPYEDKLWVNERIVDPTTIFHWYIIDENGNVLQDLGTSKSVPWGQEPSDSETDKYVKIPIDENAPSEFRMRLTGESASTCANTIDFVMYNIYDDTNFSLSGTTEVCAAAPEVTLNLTNMSGTGDLVIKKGNTVLKTETNFSGKSYTFTDDTSHGTATSVTYTVTFGDPDFCGTEKQHTVTIGSTLDVTLTSNTPDNSNVVCEGTKVTITSNRPDTETHTWYKNGVLVENVSGNVYADPDGLVDKTIYSVNVQGLCSGTGEITINVDKKPEVALNITRYNICHGDSSTVQIDYSNPSVIIPDGSTFEWKATYSNGTSAPDAYTDFETTSASGLKEHVFERAGKYTFQLEVTNGVCETVKSEKITDYIVAGAPQFTLSASETTICQDNPTTLMITMASDKAAEVTDKKWTLNGATVSGEFTESTQGANTIFSMETTPTQVGKLTYKAEVTALCSASKTIDITVVEGIIASIQEEFEICEDDDVELELQLQTTGEYSYKWTPNNGLSDNSIQRPMASPATDMTYTVEINTKEGDCPAYKTTNVKVHPKPIIESITETGIRQITAVADDKTEWPTFRIDDIDNTYENSPVVISNVPIGYHRLYITNEWGCENSDTFEISPIPVIPKKFFSPNGEGDPETEYWTVEGLDAYTSWIVEIYDRYGRRLYEYRTGSFSETGNDPTTWLGWDGNYNGHQMPSDDYWYLITVEEIRKQYSGHFILKR